MVDSTSPFVLGKAYFSIAKLDIGLDLAVGFEKMTNSVFDLGDRCLFDLGLISD